MIRPELLLCIDSNKALSKIHPSLAHDLFMCIDSSFLSVHELLRQLGLAHVLEVLQHRLQLLPTRLPDEDVLGACADS